VNDQEEADKFSKYLSLWDNCYPLDHLSPQLSQVVQPRLDAPRDHKSHQAFSGNFSQPLSSYGIHSQLYGFNVIGNLASTNCIFMFGSPSEICRQPVGGYCIFIRFPLKGNHLQCQG